MLAQKLCVQANQSVEIFGNKGNIVNILRWSALSVLALASTVLAQSHVPIKGTRNARLSASVEHAIQVDPIKDSMRCDETRDIYVPANRGHSSAWGSIVEIMADGKHFRSFSLDDVPHLDTGHIEDFEITDRGGLYVLAREVKKYSDREVPVEFGATYVLRFGPAGKLENQAKLSTDFGDVKPANLAVLKEGSFLVTSYSYTSARKVKLFASVFSPDGSLKNRVPLNGDGTQGSNYDSVWSMSVIRPMTLKSRGLIFVLRGSTRDPVYVFSDRGELIRTVRLQARDVEFSSPKIFGNQLIIQQQGPPLPSGPVFFRKESERETFPIFDLESGALVQQFEWRASGELACYDQNGLTLMQRGLDYPAHSYLAIINAQPISAKESLPSPPPAAIKLHLRWIVPCTDETHSLLLRGDDAANRYCLSERPVVDQGDIESASTYVDIFNRPGLKLTFTPDGSDKLHRATTEKKHAELGVVIDGELVFKGIVVEPLEHGVAIAGAGLHEEELLDWVARLNAKAR